MGAPAIIAALAAKDDEAILTALIGEGIGYIASNVDPLTWDPREVTGVGGSTCQVVVWQEKLWFRDETDVSVADEITVITLADSVNYLTNDVRMPEAVISRTVTTSPDEDDSPPVELGDAYLVPAASSGVWADHEDDVAIWTARGWYYRPPAIGHLLYIRDELGFVHYSESNAWEDGIGAYAIAAGSVTPSALLIRDWAVEDATTTAPPATGPAGEQYIIGPSATGAWSGHDGKLAWRPATDAAFVITTPFVGEQAYNKDSSTRVKWNGTAWETAVSGYAKVIEAEDLATLSISNNSGNAAGYTLSSTAPTSTQNDSNFADTLTCPVTADVAGQVVEVEYDASVLTALAITSVGSSITQYSIVAAFYVDGETSARYWQRIFLRKQASGAVDADVVAEFHPRCAGKLTLNDTSAHTIKVRFHIHLIDASDNTLATNSISLMNRRLIARKRSA